MKLKKMLASILCIAMVFGTMGIMVFAETTGVCNPNINGVYLGGSYDEAYLCVEVYDFYLDKTFVAKYYSDSELIAEASLNEGMLSSGKKESIGCCLGFTGDSDEYWKTTWYSAPNVSQLPDLVEIYVDDIKIAEKSGPFRNGIKGWDPDSNGNWLYELIAEDYIKINGVSGVAKIGETQYATLADAAKAADDMNSKEEIVIEILDDITLDTGIIFEKSSNITINGNGHTITLVDNPEHAAADDWYANAFRPVNQPTGFSITDEAYYSEKAGSVFTLNDMTLVNKKSGPTDVYSSGHTGRARYLTYAYAEKVYYNNIDFIGGVTSSANTYFEGCTFTTDDPEEYCLFVDHEYSSEDNKYEIEVNNCTFNPVSTAYGGLKIANQDAELVLTVEDTTFNSVPNKAAINADTNVSATLSNNVYNNCLVGTYKSDDDSPVIKTNETVTTQTELAQNTNTTVTYNTSQISTVEKASGSVTTNAENAESIAKKWCAYKFEIVPDGSKINVKVEADGKESQNKTQELANIEAKNVSIGVTVTGVDNLTSIAVTTVE